MKPTIKDVAKLANVSISTVSRVMNAPEMVVEDKRTVVQDAIEKLGYQPNALARSLIHKKTYTIGAIIQDIRNPFYAEVIRGMEDASKKLGYSLIICNTDRDKERLFSYFSNFNEKQLDGILFTSEPVLPDYYEEMKRLYMPVVLVATHSSDYSLPSVRINDEAAAYEATKYLISAGHRKIGMIGFALSDQIAGLTRHDGFLRALDEAGLGDNASNTVFLDDWQSDGCEAAEKLFAKCPDLTAVFCGSDEFAIMLISYLHDKGIRVPEQVSVMGFDNIRISQYTVPKLTTVAQPMYKMGYRAVQKLHKLILGKKEPMLREYVQHEIIVRDSVRSIQE